MHTVQGLRSARHQVRVLPSWKHLRRHCLHISMRGWILWRRVDVCPMQDMQQRCNHSRHMSHGQCDGHDVQLQCRILRGRDHMLSVSEGDIFQLCRRRAHCVVRRSADVEAKAKACVTLPVRV